MKKLSGVLAVLICSVILSAGSAFSASAAQKVTKNTAEWVEVQRAEAEAAAAAAAAEAEAQAQAEAEAQAREAAEEALRGQVVDYALSFVGGSYSYGGTDPHSGVDCSGFTRYILGAVAGLELPHNAGGQSQEGTTVSAETMQPGDLIFYGGKSVNHVAMYIGEGKVVHASTEKTGIKISSWNYRTPVRIASFLG